MAQLRCPRCRNIVANVVGTGILIVYKHREYHTRGWIDYVRCERCGNEWRPAKPSPIKRLLELLREDLGLPPGNVFENDEEEAG